MSSSDFTRQRKFSFKDLVINLLGFNRSSVKTELDRFFKSVSAHQAEITTYTKSAFTQARQKLRPESFIDLRDSQLKYFNDQPVRKKNWQGKRVVGIDGSFLILPNEECLIREFGTFSNQKQAVSAGARISIAYDVGNELILDAAIGHTPIDDEKEMAKVHLSKLNRHTDILVFDRGYPSLWFIACLKREGFDFCFRLSTGWKTAHQALQQGSKDINWTLKKRPFQEYGKLKTYDLPTEVTGLRLLSLDLPDGGKEVLLTTLADRETYPAACIKALYHRRWGTEECYKRMKQVVQIEYFSGRTVHAIKQDFHARTVLLNMASMISMQTPWREQTTPEGRVHARQINKTQAITKLKDFLIDLCYSKYRNRAIRKLLTLLKGCWDIIRPGRSFKRNKVYQYKRKALMYKGI